MSPAREEPSPPPADGNPVEAPAVSAVPARQTRNLLTLALHQIVVRIGWTFKTEQILVPAFLGTVIEAGWLRGCLPMISRLGQSIPPVFAAGWLKAVRKKKWALALFAALLGGPYLGLAWLWRQYGGQKTLWMAGAFLALHFVFFVFYGLYQVSFGTIQGKLIRPTRRGRLLWGSTFWGLFPTIFFCRWLMPDWLDPPVPGYSHLFVFVGTSFVLSALVVVLLAEPADAGPTAREEPRTSLRETWHLLCHDVNLRRLVGVIFLFGLGVWVTVPHYQSYARQWLGSDAEDLVFMVLAQTTSVTVYSLLIGPVADRWGNRLTLRVLILGTAFAPIYVLCLPTQSTQLSRDLFWIVYIPLALAPLVPTILINYALELCGPADHPRYASTVNLAMLPPYLLSVPVGGLVDGLGFRTIAVATVLLMLGCVLLTYRLDEPRHRAPSSAATW